MILLRLYFIQCVMPKLLLLMYTVYNSLYTLIDSIVFLSDAVLVISEQSLKESFILGFIKLYLILKNNQ